MKILQLAIFTLLLISIFCSCGNRNISSEEKIIKAWIGRKIIFPSKVDTLNLKKDFQENIYANYKILVYTDSAGCTSCKLQLYKWNTFIKEVGANSLVNFYFYFQTGKEDLLKSILNRDNFKIPIYIDKEGRFADNNKFPGEMKYQCFLLDANDKVLLIGNPVLNIRIWNLYKQVLESKKSEPECKQKTDVEVNQKVMELDSLEIQKESVVIFSLMGMGMHQVLLAM